jgi:glycosyltransferase involved in cell wall biosynthesis
MREPLVSIIIPCLNAAPWLADTFDSCLKQTYPAVEVIFIDNGSADASWEIAKRIESPKVRLARCGRRGASAARNEGLSLAQGEVIQYLDADDLLAPDKIAIQVARLKETSFDFIASGAWTRFKEDPEINTFQPNPNWNDFNPQEYFLTSWRRGGDMPVFSWLTPRQIIDNAGVWNENLTNNDDGEFFCRVILSSKGIKFCQNAKGYYRTVSGSLSSQRSPEDLKSLFQSAQLCVNHLLKSENSPRMRSVAADFLQILVCANYPTVPALIKRTEAEIASLGGSDYWSRESVFFNFFANMLGWKTARQMQFAFRKFRGF